MKKIIEAGASVRQLDDTQRQAWADALQPVWKQFEGDIGVDILEAAISSNN